ncbi:sulfite exporter TauE/SafE family protein [Rhizobium sp. TH2]|uniref:sulfite exporter TauE/SafE family protein n=1 Tax=Rhizobium sp. TH2 TaxID=2775403 RepID=UPI0021587855|nr:sulfite exporter TauE/SafE family protein [Rhizobium sp. TH2]UVC07194.1 sulfite exporter TauE/SafE family protein [Rhizobium sp. TH2]
MMLFALTGAFLAGLARGFSGFGSGLIFMPIASAALGPRVAVASLLVFDFIVAGVPLIRNFAKTSVLGLLPIAIGISIFIPLGGWAAAHGDPVTIRWCLSAVVFASLAMITSGFKWYGTETLPIALGLGALSGFLGGMAALSGIVIVIYWLARDMEPSQMRANMFTLLALTAVVSAVTYALNGMLTAHVFRVAILMLAPYIAGTWIGSSVFHLASAQTFRRIVYVMIFVSGVMGLPLLDSAFGR